MSESWRDSANCLRADPRLFDGLEPSEGPKPPRVVEALAYCAWCPVKAECLDDAKNSTEYEVMGVRGGIYIGDKLATKNFAAARKASGIYNTRSARPHCPKGHEFTPENTATQNNGSRQCRKCNRDRAKARRERMAA